MALFLSKTANKLDAKFRVSVPAPFRQSLENDAFSGVVAWPSVSERMIEACDQDRVERIAASLDDPEAYPDSERLVLDLARVSLASLRQLSFDVNGRILLPQDFREHAGIGEEVLFVGVGSTFQMWDPSSYDAWQKERLAAGKTAGISLNMRPLMLQAERRGSGGGVEGG